MRKAMDVRIDGAGMVKVDTEKVASLLATFTGARYHGIYHYSGVTLSIRLTGVCGELNQHEVKAYTVGMLDAWGLEGNQVRVNAFDDRTGCQLP
jgi:hypothetical protein